MDNHSHEFSVDTSCECGMMLSDYTKRLKRDNDAMLKALRGVLLTGDPLTPDGNSNFQWAMFDSALDLARFTVIAVEGANGSQSSE